MLLLASSDSEQAEVARSWLQFDARQCECFDAADKVRILAVIERYPGGAKAFNACIRDLAKRLLRGEGEEVEVQMLNVTNHDTQRLALAQETEAHD